MARREVERDTDAAAVDSSAAATLPLVTSYATSLRPNALVA